MEQPTTFVKVSDFTGLTRQEAMLQHPTAYDAWAKGCGQSPLAYLVYDDETGFATRNGCLYAFANSFDYDTDVSKWDGTRWVIIMLGAGCDLDSDDAPADAGEVDYYRLPVSEA